ncbi:rho GTPase-activating protein 17-like [Scylla paramamosain]|uniref:rho GTPase-activating protein 17-like n=1 Tax=Scylla paramamosain TaxID=85552 RepID=UPI0030827853
MSEPDVRGSEDRLGGQRVNTFSGGEHHIPEPPLIPPRCPALSYQGRVQPPSVEEPVADRSYRRINEEMSFRDHYTSQNRPKIRKGSEPRKPRDRRMRSRQERRQGMTRPEECVPGEKRNKTHANTRQKVDGIVIDDKQSQLNPASSSYWAGRLRGDEVGGKLADHTDLELPRPNPRPPTEPAPKHNTSNRSSPKIPTSQYPTEHPAPPPTLNTQNPSHKTQKTLHTQHPNPKTSPPTPSPSPNTLPPLPPPPTSHQQHPVNAESISCRRRIRGHPLQPSIDLDSL